MSFNYELYIYKTNVLKVGNIGPVYDPDVANYFINYNCCEIDFLTKEGEMLTIDSLINDFFIRYTHLRDKLSWFKNQEELEANFFHPKVEWHPDGATKMLYEIFHKSRFEKYKINYYNTIKKLLDYGANPNEIFRNFGNKYCSMVFVSDLKEFQLLEQYGGIIDPSVFRYHLRNLNYEIVYYMIKNHFNKIDFHFETAGLKNEYLCNNTFNYQNDWLNNKIATRLVLSLPNRRILDFNKIFEENFTKNYKRILLLLVYYGFTFYLSDLPVEYKKYCQNEINEIYRLQTITSCIYCLEKKNINLIINY